eukprot:Colp12_sorted_trinity150504_noHs@3168
MTIKRNPFQLNTRRREIAKEANYAEKINMTVSTVRRTISMATISSWTSNRIRSLLVVLNRGGDGLELNNDVVNCEGTTLLYVNCLHLACALSTKRVLHLHGLHDRDFLALDNHITSINGDRDDSAGHGGGNEGAGIGLRLFRDQIKQLGFKRCMDVHIEDTAVVADTNTGGKVLHMLDNDVLLIDVSLKDRNTRSPEAFKHCFATINAGNKALSLLTLVGEGALDAELLLAKRHNKIIHVKFGINVLAVLVHEARLLLDVHICSSDDQLILLFLGKLASSKTVGILFSNELGGDVALNETRVIEHITQDGDVVGDPLDHILVESSAHSLASVLTSRAVGNELSN